jgi:hypothetical protein
VEGEAGYPVTVVSLPSEGGRRDLQVCLSAVGVLCQHSPTSDGLATAWRSGQRWRRDVDLAG